ncbi:MAG: signal peptidase I [Chloroflexota bacterium]
MSQYDPQAERPAGAAADAAPRTAPGRGSAVGGAVREIIETLVLAGIIFLAVRMVVLNFRVDGESMVPNLHNEEMLLVNRNAYLGIDLGPVGAMLPGGDDRQDTRFYPFDPPQRGDVVVFDPPTRSNKPYIKRIIGLPGETVSFDGGQVYINGAVLEEPYIEEPTRCGGNSVCEITVEPDTVFVLGDNRGNSSDSRVFGLVPVGNVIGKAWVTYWPLPDFGFVPHKDYPGIPDTPMPAGGDLLPAASPEAGGTGETRPRKDRQKKDRADGAAESGTPAP